MLILTGLGYHLVHATTNVQYHISTDPADGIDYTKPIAFSWWALPLGEAHKSVRNQVQCSLNSAFRMLRLPLYEVPLAWTV